MLRKALVWFEQDSLDETTSLDGARFCRRLSCRRTEVESDDHVVGTVPNISDPGRPSHTSDA
jgi:hypothetical protein